MHWKESVSSSFASDSEDYFSCSDKQGVTVVGGSEAAPWCNN